MATSTFRESAKIYVFPVKGRVTSDVYRSEIKPGEIAAMRLPRIEWGSSWYHEAAIQDAVDSRKR